MQAKNDLILWALLQCFSGGQIVDVWVNDKRIIRGVIEIKDSIATIKPFKTYEINDDLLYRLKVNYIFFDNLDVLGLGCHE